MPSGSTVHMQNVGVMPVASRAADFESSRSGKNDEGKRLRLMRRSCVVNMSRVVVTIHCSLQWPILPRHVNRVTLFIVSPPIDSQRWRDVHCPDLIFRSILRFHVNHHESSSPRGGYRHRAAGPHWPKVGVGHSWPWKAAVAERGASYHLYPEKSVPLFCMIRTNGFQTSVIIIIIIINSVKNNNNRFV